MTTKFKPPQSSGGERFVKNMLLFLVTIITCAFGLAIFVPGPIQKSSYMGAEYCGSCHQEELKIWLSSPHAKATENLPNEHKSNLACLSCHATAVFDQASSVVKGVQCESCHGPGQYYASVHIKKDPVLSRLLFMQKPTAESCKNCHSSVAGLWSPDHAMKKIEHWPKVESPPFHSMKGQKNRSDDHFAPGHDRTW